MYYPIEQALHTDVNYILAARVGHQNLLKALFGSGEDSQRPTKVPRGADGKPIKLTPKAFDVTFPGAHHERRNIRRKGKRG